MDYDIYFENKIIDNSVTLKNNKILESLDLAKRLLYKENQCFNLNEGSKSKESTNHSVFSNKNSLDFSNHIKGIKIQSQIDIKNFEIKKVRIDNFGNEIKKGGKQKIAFADEMKIIETLDENNNKNIYKRSKNKKNSSKSSIEDFKLINKNKIRSNTPENTKSSIKKFFYNIYKNNIKNKNYFEEYLVNEIKIECKKTETKLNTFSIRKNINSEEEEQVCCSCYCSIW